MSKLDNLIRDLEEHHKYTRVILNCVLWGSNEYHHIGKVVLAEIHEVTDRNHVLAIGADRFGVYKGYYRKLGG